MGRKLGYDGYTELGYYRMGRNCYTKDDVEKFRAAVVKYVVPVAASVYEAQAKRLGKTYPMTFADNALAFRSGNPKPCGTPDDILAQGKQFYASFRPRPANSSTRCCDNELLDVLSTPGKRAGGYCTSLGDYHVPFIFANFNGTQHDVEVVTHEAGHAFAAYLNRDRVPTGRSGRAWRPARCIPCPWNSSRGRGQRASLEGYPQVPLQPSGRRADLHPLRHDGRSLPAHRL